ncbi:hypothetical protein V8G54_004292 [Vigna mungo]|uniref:Uncharacterized protein n=1 Tax=Vigna mungo TaxID=3915 RepID=A0AAQ3PFX7_VIGMU
MHTRFSKTLEVTIDKCLKNPKNLKLKKHSFFFFVKSNERHIEMMKQNGWKNYFSLMRASSKKEACAESIAKIHIVELIQTQQHISGRNPEEKQKLRIFQRKQKVGMCKVGRLS